MEKNIHLQSAIDDIVRIPELLGSIVFLKQLPVG